MRSTAPLGVMIADAPGNGLSPGQRQSRRLADLCNKVGQVRVGLLNELLATELSAHCILKELGRRQAPLLHLPVKIVRQVHLHPRHTPEYTPIMLTGTNIAATPVLEHMFVIRRCESNPKYMRLVGGQVSGRLAVPGPDVYQLIFPGQLEGGPEPDGAVYVTDEADRL